MNIKILEGYVEFYNFLDSYDLRNLSPSFHPFLQAYDSINKGCGCGRAKRIETCQNLYREIVDNIFRVDSGLLKEAKLKAQVSEIQFYLDGHLIYQG